MSLLIAAEQAEFVYLKERTGATSGNLSVQVQKLKSAGYISVKKSFKGNYPQTTCKVTTAGVDAFEKHVEALESYIKPRS